MIERKYICQSKTWKRGLTLLEYVKTCLVCGVEMVRRKHNEAIRKNWLFCSYKCRTIHKNKSKVWKESEIKKLSDKAKRRWLDDKYKKLLSSEFSEKVRKNNTGEKSHFWIDGRTPLLKRLRNTAKMVGWRKRVFERDDYTCVLCLKRGGELNADHIKPFSKIVRKHNIKTFKEGVGCGELWDTKNGRTLCLSCHKKTPSFGRRGI